MKRNKVTMVKCQGGPRDGLTTDLPSNLPKSKGLIFRCKDTYGVIHEYLLEKQRDGNYLGIYQGVSTEP